MFQKKQKADLVPEQFYSVLYAIHKYCQKQLFEIGVFKICNIHQKTPALEPFSPENCSFIKKRPQHKCFPVKISQNGHSLSFVVTGCQLLSLVVISCHSLSLVVPLVASRCTTPCHSLSVVVICCHSLYHSLSFVATRCITRLSFHKRSSRELKI